MGVERKVESPNTAVPILEPSEAEEAGRRFRAWCRFRRNKLAVGGVITVVLVLLVVFPLAPVVAPIDRNRINIKEIGLSPGENGHLLGTDLTGRDLWSRLVYGGRVSMSVGVVAVSLYVTIGTILGSLAGFYGGWVDALIMRITDTVMAFPTLIILIVIVSFIGRGVGKGMLAIGLIGWTGVARLVRGQVLSIREMDYIMAARCLGVPERRIIGVHILPNVVAPITIAASFGVAGTIITEASLSFLGLGVPPPEPSWGIMIGEARSIQVLENMPWLWVPPGLLISICVLAINFIGDGLREALDPRLTLD